MNDNTKVLDQNPSTVAQVGPVQPQTPVQPAAPAAFDAATVGIANKEMGPIRVAEIRPAGTEVRHEISQESAELGVREVQDRLDLTLKHQQIGLEHSGATVPVPLGPTGLVQIPKKDISSSATWLNALTEKIQKVLKLMGV